MCIAAVRVLGAEQPTAAKSGHPGAAMGCAPMAHALWGHAMHFSPEEPKWANRDRFVLSNGHACALQYAMLHLTGYDLPLKELEHFRKLHSKTPGHPENFITPGVEVCTGPLGQGLSNAVGLALGRAHLAATYNRPGFSLFDHCVYVICGDGCLMEGMTSEACALAVELGLSRLVLLYDDNHITIDGSTDLAFTEDVSKRFEAYGWAVAAVGDGDTDIASLLSETMQARASEQPAFIKVTTTIGYGSSKAGNCHVHGTPLNPEDLGHFRKSVKFPEHKAFHIPPLVSDYYKGRGVDGDGMRTDWKRMFARFLRSHPSAHAELSRRLAGELLNPAVWRGALASIVGQAVDAGDVVLCTLLKHMPELFGGSMAKAPPLVRDSDDKPVVADFTPEKMSGRHIQFGAGREHAAAACCVGLAAYGGFIPYWRSPLAALPNGWGAIRLSALGQFRVLHIATYDGTDPATLAAMCHATPNLALFQPADTAEVAGAYTAALLRRDRPTVVVLPAPGTTALAGTSLDGASRGGYVVAESSAATPTAVLVATGPMLAVSLAAQAVLAEQGIQVRIVSMPSWELFEDQPEDYRQNVLGATGLKASMSRPPVIYAERPAAAFGFERFASACLSDPAASDDAGGEGLMSAKTVAAQVKAIVET